MDLYQELEWREMVYGTTEGLREVLDREKVTAYIGFDPTAASLHVGSLLTLMGLARLQRHGHTPIALVGGGTGLIGDPSGKSLERSLLTFEQVEANAQGIRTQLERFLDFTPGLPNAALMRNNVEWLRPIGVLDFLRDVGKHFTVNYMMSKESVRRRLEGEEGLSFTEFSYQLLQAYDYLVLHDRDRCTLQMGGTDQWGNITAGCDLIRKMRGKRVHGLVWPLMTTASGTKFGKTEAGTVWLDQNLTGNYEFYQFWLKTDDRDVIKHLKSFTFLNQTEIADLEYATKTAPEERRAQHRLADEVTSLVRGKEGLDEAKRITAALFGLRQAGPEMFGTSLEPVESPAVQALVELGKEMFGPVVVIRAADFPDGIPAVELIVRSKLATSKSQAGRLIEGRGFYVNDAQLDNPRAVLGRELLQPGRMLRLRKGQRERRLVMILE